MLLALLLACSVRTSTIRSLDEATADGAIPRAEADCTWVTVEETRDDMLFGIRMAHSETPHDEALFYCCPESRTGTPHCTRADWYVIKDPQPAGVSKESAAPPEAAPSPVASVRPAPAAPLSGPPLVTALAYGILNRTPDAASAEWTADVAFISRQLADGHDQDEILRAVQVGAQLMGSGRDLQAIVTAGLAR